MFLGGCPLIIPLMRVSRSNGSKGRACFQMVVSTLGREAGDRLPVAAGEKIGEHQMEAMAGYKR